MDFAVPADHREKAKRKTNNWTLPEKKQKQTVEYEGDGDTDCSWGTWNGSQRPGKRLEEQAIRGRIETIQTSVFLKLARIFWSITCCHLESSEKPPAKARVKNSYNKAKIDNNKCSLYSDRDKTIYHPVLARRLHLELIKKKKQNSTSRGFCLTSRPQNENERKRKDRRLSRSCLRDKKSCGAWR